MRISKIVKKVRSQSQLSQSASSVCIIPSTFRVESDQFARNANANFPKTNFYRLLFLLLPSICEKSKVCENNHFIASCKANGCISAHYHIT